MNDKCENVGGKREGEQTFEDFAHLCDCDILSTRQDLDGCLEIADLTKPQEINQTIDFHRSRH